MIWNRRKPAQASRHAVEYLETSDRQLKEAQALRVEAFELGASLNHSRQLNHFGLGLERAIKGTM